MRLTWGTKTQVLLIAFIPVIAVSIFLGSYFTRNLLQNMQDSLWKNGIATALELAFSAEQGVFYGYPDMLQLATDKAVSQEDIYAAAVFDKNHTMLAHSGKLVNLPSDDILNAIHDSFTTIDTDNSVRFIAPITLHDIFINDKDDELVATKGNSNKQTIGWVCVEVAHSTITGKKLHVLKTSFFILLLGLFISSLFVAKTTQELRDTLKTIEKQNAELEIARKEALLASQVKSDFLANMSHEIRTPMNGILGFISLLLESELNALQKEYLQIVQQSADSLLTILNDILDLSKFEAGKFDLEHISFDIRKAIKESLLILSANARAKNIHLVAPLYHDIPAKMKGDPFRIKQVITNLVANAIKFTDSGSITLHCSLQKETERHLVLRISVTDTGPGIGKPEQAKLFQAFSQADASITRRHGGTGLGLVICKKIVTQMQGDIGIESERGLGATFWFTLTLEKDQSWYDDVALSADVATEAHPIPFQCAIKVLVVDDNQANLKLVSTLLSELNVTVSVAHDGFEALEIAQTQAFDLILMDIQMPGLDGVAATKRIKQENTYNQHTPIIALTALSTPNEHRYFLDQGMTDCLTKPITAKQLRQIVEKWYFHKETPEMKTAGSTISSPTQLPVIDWPLAEKLAGNNSELAKELIEMLIDTLVEDKEIIRLAVKNHDIPTLKRSIHRLHGGCCYCGVPQLKDVIIRFETFLKQTNTINDKTYRELMQAIDNILTANLSYSL